MRFACRVTKVTNTHSEYAIPIAFLRQQWLRERASMLRYTYSATPPFSANDAPRQTTRTITTKLSKTSKLKQTSVSLVHNKDGIHMPYCTQVDAHICVTYVLF